MKRRNTRGRRGSALIESTLLAPWVLFLFVGMVDIGFFSYSMICVENAVRIGAEYTSSGSLTAANQAGACTRGLNELSSLPNVSSLSTCGAAPLVVTAETTTGPDGAAASKVTVTYQSAQLIPIPGLLMGKLYITRNIVMKVKP
jgi:Flp pilus assembly protein TadG